MISLNLPALLIVSVPLWVIWRLWANRKRGSFSWNREIAYSGTFIYALALIYFAFFPLRIHWSGEAAAVSRPINWKPLAETLRTFGISPRLGLYHVFGNILMFLPFGIFVPMLSRRWRDFGPAVSMAFRVSIAIEFIQYLIGGHVSDVDDVILNTLGAAIGWSLYYLASRRLNKGAVRQRVLG